ncbi:hypothetical protein HDU93_004852 [Gonapodya sp. JEL0774]|nr:hypothetical protein HDU93_004852 [Gonapodya sp. JEL0774]
MIANRFLRKQSAIQSIAKPTSALRLAPSSTLTQLQFSTTPTPRKNPVVPPIAYEDADTQVREVYDEMIKAFELKGPHQINDFWKVLANHYPSFKGTWDRMKVVMAPGALDPLVKEMICVFTLLRNRIVSLSNLRTSNPGFCEDVAVSTSNGCDYCVASHTASARKLGMTDDMMGELQAVVAMANETNRLAFGYRVGVDEMYEKLYVKTNEKKVAERKAAGSGKS